MLLARLLALTCALLAAEALAEHAPVFDVKDLDGHRYTLGGLSGKVIVLNFWFKNCPACRNERTTLNRVVTRYDGHPDVVFLAPALDKAADLEPFLDENPFYYAVIPDAEKLADTYDVSAYPTHIVIGRDGNIVRRWSGALGNFRRLTEIIDAQLGSPGTSSLAALISTGPTTSASWEQPLLISPEHPTRGATVKLYYAPEALEHPEAQLAWDVHGDNSFTQGAAPMRPQGVLLSYELKLPEDATLVHLRIVSREDRRLIEQTVPISGADGQPVRNAFINVGACDAKLPVDRELSRYPDSPFALLARLEERLGSARASPDTVHRELLELLKTAHGNGLELLAVTADVLLMEKDFLAVKQVLDTMMAIDRDGFLTRRALSRLLTQPYGDVSRPWPEGLLPWAWGVLAERDDVWSRRAASQSAPGVQNTEAVEKICATWTTAEPDNPFAHDCLARILEHEGRFQEALRESRAALDAVSAGKLPLYQPASWSRMAQQKEEELWARYAEFSLKAKSWPELAGAAEP